MRLPTCLALAFGLASCAGPGVFYAYGHNWEPNPNQPDCPEVSWIQKPPLVVQNYCGAIPGVIGCTLYASCIVVSMYSREEAHLVDPYNTGLSHYDHEVVWHIARKLRHPDGEYASGRR